MDKEEILAKSRQEKKDEGMTEAENRGRRIGVMAFSAIFIFIVLFNLFNGQPNYAPMAMFWASFQQRPILNTVLQNKRLILSQPSRAGWRLWHHSQALYCLYWGKGS